MRSQSFCQHGRQDVGLIIICERAKNINIFNIFLSHQVFVCSITVQYHRVFELIRHRFGAGHVALHQLDMTMSLLEIRPDAIRYFPPVSMMRRPGFSTAQSSLITA